MVKKTRPTPYFQINKNDNVTGNDCVEKNTKSPFKLSR